MAYDAARGNVVLFGGGGPPGFLSDTWTWNGSQWTQRFPASNPPGRDNSGVTYDVARAKVVLFGGYNGAIALRAANADAFSRYSIDKKILAASLERWPELRREREQRERHCRTRRRSTIELAQQHCWKGLD